MLRTYAVLVGIMLLSTSLTASNYSQAEESTLPEWVKNIFVWFGQGVISESELLGAIEWLVENKIIRVSSSVNDEFFEKYKDWAKSEITKYQEYSDKLQTENKNLRGDLEFLEKENAELRNKQATIVSTPTPPTTPSDPLDIYAKTNPIIRAMQNGEVKFYFNELPYYADDNLKNTVAEVTKMLQTGSYAKAKLTRVYDQSSADVIIAWIKDFGGHRLGEAFPQYLNIGVGGLHCDGNWENFDQNTLTQIIWHEIGHSAGFLHSSDVNNVMSGAGFDPRFDHWKIRPDGYHMSKFGNTGEGHEVTLCKGTYTIDLEFDRPVDVKLNKHTVIAIKDDAGNIIEIRDDTICGQDQTTHFRQTCVVDNIASLYIWFFEEREIVGYTVKIDRIDAESVTDKNWDKNAFKYPTIYSNLFN